MSFTIVDCEQRSPAWFAARCSRVTSSRAADMLATVKSGEAAGRRNLRAQLLLERLTNQPQEKVFPPSRAMQQGIDRERAAGHLYEAVTGRILSHCGFLRHDTILCGASLDGYVRDFEGCVEIKSPIAATHWDYLQTNIIPDAYRKQAVHQLFVSGAQWCDFVSYNPDFSERLRLKIVRIPRDEAEMKSYHLALTLFLSEVEKEYEKALRLEEGAA